MEISKKYFFISQFFYTLDQETTVHPLLKNQKKTYFIWYSDSQQNFTNSHERNSENIK